MDCSLSLSDDRRRHLAVHLLLQFSSELALFATRLLVFELVPHGWRHFGDLVNELAAHAIRAITVCRKFLAQLRLVVVRNVGLHHHVCFAVSKGALYRKLVNHFKFWIKIAVRH